MRYLLRYPTGYDRDIRLRRYGLKKSFEYPLLDERSDQEYLDGCSLAQRQESLTMSG